jgi:5-methyltetrahydrofolate--homocysteine methyltransferase
VPFGPFVADFYCLESRIVVEVDGSVHDGQTEQDTYRDAYMTAHGYRVIRFTNDEVLTNLPTVLTRITNLAHAPRLPLSPEGEGVGG